MQRKKLIQREFCLTATSGQLGALSPLLYWWHGSTGCFGQMFPSAYGKDHGCITSLHLILGRQWNKWVQSHKFQSWDLYRKSGTYMYGYKSTLWLSWHMNMLFCDTDEIQMRIHLGGICFVSALFCCFPLSEIWLLITIFTLFSQPY